MKLKNLFIALIITLASSLTFAECEDWSKAFKNTQNLLEKKPFVKKVTDLKVVRAGLDPLNEKFYFSFSANITMDWPLEEVGIKTDHWLGVVEIKEDCSAVEYTSGTSGTY